MDTAPFCFKKKRVYGGFTYGVGRGIYRLCRAFTENDFYCDAVSLRIVGFKPLNHSFGRFYAYLFYGC